MNNNPFVLPGFGQTGPMGQNPILASMEMMRQAWEGLASSGGMDAAAMGRMMSVEEMDKRIADLRAVENWLRMNLSMLSSTIQGLEVQRATVSTLKSFVDTSMASMQQPAEAAEAQARPRAASSLDEVLGLKPGPAGAAPQAAQPAPQAPAAASAGQAAEPPQGEADASQASGEQAEQPDILAQAASATQGWWNLLQQQFQTLAAATAASAEGALADMAEAGKAVAETQAAAASASPPASKTAAKRTESGTARKAAAKKSAARTAGKSATKTAAKATRKTPAARKTTS